MRDRLYRGGDRDRGGGRRDDFDPIAEGEKYDLSPEISLKIWDRVCAETTTEEQAIHRFHEVAARARRLGGQLQIAPGKITLLEAEIYGRDPSWDAFATISPGKITRVEVEAQRHARATRGHAHGTRDLPHHQEVMALLRANSAEARDGAEYEGGALASAFAFLGDEREHDPERVESIAEPERAASMPLALATPAVEVPQRDRMETFFGTSFAGVEAHVGEAPALAAHGARGAAFGNTVVFAAEDPAPETIVHELAHIAQLRQTSPDTRDGAAAMLRPWSVSWDAAEVEADHAASAYARGASSARVSARPASAISFDQTAAPPAPRFEVSARYPGGFDWKMDEARGKATLLYRGEAWLTVRWDHATRPSGTLRVDTTEQIDRGLGPQSRARATVNLVIESSFKVTVDIDRAVEQSIANYDQADLAVYHDLRTEGPITVRAVPPPGVTSVWEPVNTEGPQRLLTQYEFVPVDVELPIFKPREALAELPPNWVFADEPAMRAFVAAQSGPWMMWRTTAEPTDMPAAGNDMPSTVYVASQLTDAGIAARAGEVRGDAAKARIEGLAAQPEAGGVLGFKIWDGITIGSASELANYYFPYEMMAARDPISGERTECEVFAMIGTQGPSGVYYGRTPLSAGEARARWKQMDALAGVVGASRGRALFRSLQVRAAGDSWVSVDEGYFAGRSMFLANLALFQMGDWMSGTSMVDVGNGASAFPLPYVIGTVPGGDDLGRWVKAQLFRTEPDPVFLATLQNEHVADNAQDVAKTEVINQGQKLVHDALVEGITQLGRVADSTDALRSVLMRMPSLDQDQRSETFRFLGLDTGETGLAYICASPRWAAELAMGNEVSGQSLPTLQQKIAAHRDQLEAFRERVAAWEFPVVQLDGEIGEWSRKLAYQRLGFRVDAGDYPHRGATSGIFPGPMAGDRGAFANLGEQMWANHATEQANARVAMIVIAVSATVALSVAVILAASVAGAAIASLAVAGEIVTEGSAAFVAIEVISSAGVYTGLEEGISQIQGQGNIDLSDPAGSAKRVGKAWLWNAVTFGAFRLLSAGFAALSKGAVRGVMGEEFAASRSGQAWANRLRFTGIGASFVAVNVAMFEMEHGRLPSSDVEYIEVVYGALLSVALLEAGAVLSRPFAEQSSGWARARRLDKISQRIDAFQAKANALNAEVARYAGGREPPPELAEKQIALLREQAALVSSIRDATRGTADADEADAWADKELSTIGDAIATLEHAKFLSGARIRPVSGQPEVFEYESGTNALEKIREYYGKGNVTPPGDDGIIRVRDGDRILEFRPQRPEAASGESREEFAEDRERRLDQIEARVGGKTGHVVRETEALALDSEWQVDAGLRVADPLFGKAASDALKQAAAAHRGDADPGPAAEIKALGDLAKNLQGRMLEVLRDPSLDTTARRRALRSLIGELEAAVKAKRTLFPDSVDFDQAFRFAEARAAVDSAIDRTFDQKLTLDAEGVVHRGRKRVGTFRDLMDNVLATNRAFAEAGEQRELIIAVSETNTPGMREVLVLSRPRAPSTPGASSGEPLPVQTGTDPNAVIVDVGAGESSFALDLLQPADRTGGPVVQTEYGPSAFDASRTRRDLTWENAVPRTDADSVVVFGDPLQTMDLLFGEGGVKRVFINNVNAHYEPPQYASLARVLLRAMAPQGRVEVQWTDAPEYADGTGDRGHIAGDKLNDALDAENVGHRPITIDTPPAITDYQYSIEPSRRKGGADPSKTQPEPPVPKERWIFTFGDEVAGGSGGGRSKPGGADSDAATATKEWADRLRQSTPESARDPATITKEKAAYEERRAQIEQLYEDVMSGKTEPPRGVTREQLRLAVEGDAEGTRVPLTFGGDVALFKQFQVELSKALADGGVSDATVQQVGSATLGWKGNPKKDLGPWRPESDADCAVFSVQALGQARAIGAPVNKGVVMSGEYSVLKNDPAVDGFYKTKVGEQLQALARRWNTIIYGSADADGFDFKLNLGTEPFASAITLVKQ